MSYNIDTFKVKVLENLSIPIKSFYKHKRDDWHPNKPVIIDIDKNLVKLECCDLSIKGILKENVLHVTELEIHGEGSGTFMGWIFEPALKDSKGKLEVSCVWEGGDTINKLTVIDGNVEWKDIEI